MFNNNLINYFLIISVSYLLYHHLTNKNNIEKMSYLNTIRSMINKIYKADVQSIRNLAEVSQKLQRGGLTIAGNLNIKGNLDVNGTAKRKGSNFALESKLNSATKSLTSKINSTNSSLTNKLNAYKRLIDANTRERVKPGVVWAINRHGRIYWRNENDGRGTWRRVGGKLKNVGVGKHYIWGVNKHNNIYRCKKPCRGSWERQAGGLSQIDAGH